MLLTDGLGEEVAARLDDADQRRLPPRGASGRRFEGGRFEEWLSYLAEDQPHLDAPERFRNRALVSVLTKHIQRAMSQVQFEALMFPAPPWLYELLSVLHILRATVITTNYDNLVECAVAKRAAPLVLAGGRWLPVDEEDILEGRPRQADFLRFREIADKLEQSSSGIQMSPLIVARTARVFLFGDRARIPDLSAPQAPRFVDWYWVPEDAAGYTLQRGTLPGTFESPEREDEEERNRAYLVPSLL